MWGGSLSGTGVLGPSEFLGPKAPVWDFSPADDGDPREVDAFNAMIRELRDQDPGVHPDAE
jgi:hypothetical protein